MVVSLFGFYLGAFLCLIFKIAIVNSSELSSDRSNNNENLNNDHLPRNCSNYNIIKKKTQAKAGICVMIKDEEGFLSEYVAYYIIHGINHIIFYDDGSTDNSKNELKPWIDSGYVTIKTDWEGYLGKSAVTWGKQMHQKKMMERDCKLTLHQWNYDYHISVDIDEYNMPLKSDTTLVDEVNEIFKKNPKRGVFNVNKLNFNSKPHIMEPFNLLQIEAYLHRWHVPNKFGPKQGVMKKTVYRLKSPYYSNATLELILECCTFHSCRQGPLKKCWKLHDDQIGNIFNKPWPDAQFVIFHYARSLEKFSLKQRTWKQHVKSGYGLEKYFDRMHGWTVDTRMLRYSCQVREFIAKITKNNPFIRTGNWYRKYELEKNPGLYLPTFK